MWAAGLEERAATVTFEMPPARRWQAATQLFGKFQTITEPGLRWYYPAPIGRVQKESVTETKTKEDIDTLVGALEEVI